jgi:hypothetical protein
MSGTFMRDFCYNKLDSEENLIKFYIKSVYFKYNRYPQNFVSGLTKIGGLVAVLQIGIILSFIHRKIYEKEIN